MEKENLDSTIDTVPGDTLPEQPTPVLQAGEKVFQIVLFLAGLWAFSQAYALWQTMSEPRVSSAAALPLFMSGAWTLFALWGVITNLKKDTPLSKISDWKIKILGGLQYAFPQEMLVTLLAVLAYCGLLFFKVNFYIATVIFLYGTMCYLRKKGYVQNILWTAIVMAFIVVVFSILFGVVFP